MNNKAHLRPQDFDSNGDIIPTSMKETTFDDYLKEQLKDPEFRKEWDKLCDEDMQKGGNDA